MSDDDVPALARRVRTALTETETTVAVAESSTGGLVGSKITDVAGASEYFDRSVVTYSNEAKMDLLDVDQETLEEKGAVSADVATQMARGVRASAGTDWGLSTTGIAGPGGGTENKPVGTIFIGTAWRESDGGESASATRYHFDGSRLECKEQFVTQALTDLLDIVAAHR